MKPTVSSSTALEEKQKILTEDTKVKKNSSSGKQKVVKKSQSLKATENKRDINESRSDNSKMKMTRMKNT